MALATIEGESETGPAGLGERAGTALQGLAARLWHALESERPRWFLWWPVFFGVGIALYFQQTVEPGLAVALALPLGAFALRMAVGHVRGLSFCAGLALIAACGFAAAKLRTEWVRAPVLERQMGPVEVKGVVALVEPRPGRGQRLTLDKPIIEGLPPEKTPARVRIRTMQSLEGVRPGDHVIVHARLGPPSPPSMPGDYDFARAAWFQRLGAIGYAMKAAIRDEEPTGQPAAWSRRWGEAVERLRQAIGARVVAVLPGERGAIATALITGERGAITAATNDAFRDSGLLHILSISGLHMVVMAGAVFVLIRVLLAAFPAIVLNFPTKTWAAGAALIAAAGYLTISGASVATQRSWLMTSIMLIAVMLGRPALALRNVALAALAILAVTPESLNDVGFQMSFAAVVSLIVVYEAARGHLGLDRGLPPGPLHQAGLFFAGIALTTLAASIAVAPFAAYHFHKSQQYAMLANLAAIPVCNVLVMPAGLAALIAMPWGLEAWPLLIMGSGIDMMTATAASVAALPGAVGHIPAVPASAFMTMVAGGLWFALWHQRGRYLGLAVIALGAGMTPFIQVPSLLVGREGALVALRGADGRLSLITGRGTAFEARRWLEHDGDARAPADASKGGAFLCDGVGCTGPLAGKQVVAVPRHPAALRDDCLKVRILILDIPRPAWCQGPETVIDYPALRKEGTHALYASPDGQIRIETVNGWRGARPWVQRWNPQTKESRPMAANMSNPSAREQTDDPPSTEDPGFDAMADD